MKNWDWRAAAAGAAAGLANGFFGAGGGMLLVPLLAGWCRLPGKTCFTTALAVMLPLTLVSLAIYWHSGQLPFSLAWPYLAGGFLGGVGGGLLLRRVSGLQVASGRLGEVGQESTARSMTSSELMSVMQI